MPRKMARSAFPQDRCAYRCLHSMPLAAVGQEKRQGSRQLGIHLGSVG